MFFSVLLYAAFLKNCGRGESLGTTTLPDSMVEGMQWHSLQNTFAPSNPLLCVSNFMEIIRQSQS